MKKFVAGTYQDQKFYHSFQPNPIDRKWGLENMEVITLLGKADRNLGRLDMYSKYVPNLELFTTMHVLKEATQSSKIEGTMTNIDEATLQEEDVPLDKRDDWEEVQNYYKALNWSVNELAELPFSSRLIRGTHKILLQGVRGERKHPGEFRTSQNWIGGSSIDNAVFVPPVHTSIPELMNDIEKFIHNEEDYFPELLKIALVHYQFETIHPFLDGNGRIGRLMIPLYLVDSEILRKPVLYLSDYFERNRRSYYEHLTLVREANRIDRWFIFFLKGLIETAKKGIETFDNILQLQKETDVKIQSFGSRAVNAQKVVHYLYEKPVIDAEKVSEITGLSTPSAYKLVADLESKGILLETTGGQRGRKYKFENYVKLFRD